MDLESLSKETLIRIVNDLQKEVHKLKIDADKKIKEIEKRLESQIEYINKKPLKIDTFTQTEEPVKEDDNFNISAYQNIWYMNGNEEYLDKWDLKVLNGFVTSWNDNGKNNSLLNKLNIGDLIAWYIVGKGYNSILEVKGEPHEITDNELKIFCDVESKRKCMKEHNYTIITIPVHFLVTSAETFILNNKSFTELYNSEWTYGLRGSHCIKPKNEKWKEQVKSIYTFLKENQ